MIGGSSGTGMANKIINTIFDHLMTPALISTYTWRGRAKGNLRKNPFQNYHNIHLMIFTILNKVQQNYTMTNYFEDMKKKVFKYAYLKSPESVAAEDFLSDIDSYDVIL